MTSMVSSLSTGPEGVWSAAFDEMCKRIGPLFGRPQTRESVQAYLRGLLSITELCALYGISRKTGYKFIDRYLRAGPAGLEERSRRPRQSPNHTAPETLRKRSASRQRRTISSSERP